MLISEAFQLYREAEITARGLSSKTLESYVYAEKLVVAYFGDITASDITAVNVRKFYEHLLSWQKPDTARGNIVCLRAVIKMLFRNDKTVLDPEEIRIPKREKREIVFLTEAEVEEFIDAVSIRKRGYAEINRLRNIAIVKTLFSSGIRVGELCRLNRNSIKNRQFTVIGKSKSPRLCFISEEAAEAIDVYLGRRPDSNQALFISNQNEKRITPGNVRRIFQNACDRSEFSDVHPHTLRHSFATFMLARGVDIRYIGDLMGHESLDTTRVYTHYSNPRLKQIYDSAMNSRK